jgi:hypothetical protein
MRTFQMSQDTTLREGTIEKRKGGAVLNGVGLNMGIGLVIAIRNVQFLLSVNTAPVIIQTDKTRPLKNSTFGNASIAYPISNLIRYKYKNASTRTISDS